MPIFKKNPSPELILEFLNGSNTAPFLNQCASNIIMHGSVLGLKLPDRDPLGFWLHMYRSVFPDLHFSMQSSSETSSIELSFKWIATGTHKGPIKLIEPTHRLINIPGSCRVRFEDEKIKELWLNVDSYTILQQLGRILPEPGQSTGQSAALNQLAAESLCQAIRRRETNALGLDEAVILHANINTYVELGKSIALNNIRLDGANQTPCFLKLIKQQFTDIIELTLDQGISQGSTTTFRGSIQGTIGSIKQRYDFICSFVSPATCVTEYWIQINPPPTLMECIS